MYKSALGLVAFEVAEFNAISFVLPFVLILCLQPLNNDSITADRMSHVSKVNLRASTLVSWKHEACVPRARNNIVCHSAVFAFTEVESTAVTLLSRELFLVRSQLFIICLDSVDDVLVDK